MPLIITPDFFDRKRFIVFKIKKNFKNFLSESMQCGVFHNFEKCTNLIELVG
jgi:hypothetical protein